MTGHLDESKQEQLLARGYSRRDLGRIGMLLSAGAALPFYNEITLAQSAMPEELPPGAVKINSNESPYGPCAEAQEAMIAVIRKGHRYMHERGRHFSNLAADIEGLKRDYAAPFAGSSDPLARVMLAYTSPTKPLVMATLGYEAAARTASFIGAKVIRVPVRSDGSHDVQAMVKADPDAGVLYICNPNNPGGGITKRADIDWALANKPKGSLLLVDECYIQFTDEPVTVDLVAKDKDVIILRTFSKLYGMAGLRAGVAFGRPDLLSKLTGWGVHMLPVTGMVGGEASLKSRTVIAERKKLCKDAREDTYAFLEKKGIKYLMGYGNFFMMDFPGGAQRVSDGLRKEKVYISGAHQVYPNLVRVTVGSMEEMKKFQTALAKVA